MISTNILPVGSMGLVYLPNIYHKKQSNVGKWEKQVLSLPRACRLLPNIPKGDEEMKS